MAGNGQFNAASAAIFRDDAVLLIKRALPPYRGVWTLPGGRIEAGESAETCVCREIEEELGLRISPQFVMRHEVTHTTGAFALAVFAASFDGGQVTHNDEVAEWRWAAPYGFAALKTTAGLEQIVALASQLITPV